MRQRILRAVSVCSLLFMSHNLLASDSEDDLAEYASSSSDAECPNFDGDGDGDGDGDEDEDEDEDYLSYANSSNSDEGHAFDFGAQETKEVKKKLTTKRADEESSGSESSFHTGRSRLSSHRSSKHEGCNSLLGTPLSIKSMGPSAPKKGPPLRGPQGRRRSQSSHSARLKLRIPTSLEGPKERRKRAESTHPTHRKLRGDMTQKHYQERILVEHIKRNNTLERMCELLERVVLPRVSAQVAQERRYKVGAAQVERAARAALAAQQSQHTGRTRVGPNLELRERRKTRHKARQKQQELSPKQRAFMQSEAEKVRRQKETF